MYLSRLALDLRSREARRDTGDAYEMHRTLARAFVADEQSRPARFLWRLEASAHPGAAPTVLVQSGVQADWSFLQTLGRYALRVESKHVPLERLIQEGRSYRFRLLANPTVTRQGKRLGLVGVADQLAWLARQGERHGFLAEPANVSASDWWSRREDSNKRKQIQVQRICFEGMLRAERTSDLCSALRAGIGPAKAFGCGLLSIAPV